MLGQLDYMMLAASSRYMNTAVTAPVFNTYTLIAVILTTYLFRGSNCYQPIRTSEIPLYLLGLASIGLNILSQQGNLNSTQPGTHLSTTGIILTLTKPVTSALEASALRWRCDIAQDANTANGKPPPERDPTCCSPTPPRASHPFPST